MGEIVSRYGRDVAISSDEKREVLSEALAEIEGGLERVLLLPPDFTRYNSNAGELTAILYDLLSDVSHVDIMPTLGTHFAMTDQEIRTMFGSGIPRERFHTHDWRHGVRHVGDIPGARVNEWSEGKLDFSVRIDVAEILFGGYDLILSIGQVVPHEVIGMANYTKNILVGAGGSDIINKSHFLGAVYGMERIMGRIDTPVRRLIDYGAENFLSDLPIKYVFTVMSKDRATGGMGMRGLFVGDDMATYSLAAQLSRTVNFDLLPDPLTRVVVYLDPEEFKSTWLGNKAIYRTRMALADDGELVILAPGLREFGEDPEIDRLIRKYGYRGTAATLDAVRENDDLAGNLSAAAHLIHGSSEGRFTIRYCPGPGVSAEEIEAVGFQADDLDEMMERYDPRELKDGPNTMPDGEEIFFVSNPALGLWALEEHFASS